MAYRVLVVDDAAFMRMMIKNILIKNGFEIAGEAENGAEGAKVYQKVQPDLVTMDITMPEVDGLAGVKAIMALDPGAKVIMVSAMGQQGMVMEAINAGAKDFLVKPFQEEKMLASIKRALGR